jgi:hypothetical protein
MNQFLSDVYLIVPDTKGHVSTLNDRVSSNQGKSTYKQSALASLQTTINAWITNLVKVTQDMNTGDTNYYNNLGNIVSNISALQDPNSSPTILQVTALNTAIQDRLNLLNSAAAQYLSVQRDNVKNIANYIYDLYKNDQAIVGNSASNLLTTESAKAATLQTQINDLRSYFQSNLTNEASNVAALKIRVAAAKADSDTRAQAAKATILSNIQSGVATAMTSANTAFQSQLAQVQTQIDARRNSSFASYDGLLSQALANNAALDAVINTNLSGSQSSYTALSQQVDLNVNGANSTATGTLDTLTSGQAKFQSNINSQIGTLNGSISAYVEKVAQTSSNIFGQSQTFMQSFSNLASDAASSASGSMKAGATADANSLSGLNSVVGDVSGGAASRSASSATAMADQLAAAKDSAAVTNMKQLVALADAINTMNALVSLLKAKLGFSSDKQGVQATSVQGLLTTGAASLSKTLNAITRKATNTANSVIKSTSIKLNQMKAISNEGKRRLDTRLADIRRVLDKQITSVTLRRNGAVNLGQKVVNDGGTFAQRIAAANTDLANKVGVLQADINSKWQVVNETNMQFRAAVNASLTGLSTQANAMADAQLAAALSYVGNKSMDFSGLISQSQARSLTAQAGSLSAAMAAVRDLQNITNATQIDAYKLARDTVIAVNATVNSALLLPPILVSASQAADLRLVNIKNNGTVAFNARVDALSRSLYSTIANYTSSYRNSSTSQLDPVNASIQALGQALNTQVQLMNVLFPAGVNIFNLSSDQFVSLLNNASAAVASASSSIDSRYTALYANLTNAYNTLAAQINAAGTAAQTLAANVSSGVSGSQLVAQQQIFNDKASFETYANTVVNQFIANRSREEDATRSMAGANQASFDAIILSGSRAITSIMSQIQNVSASEAAKQAVLADAMDDIVQALIAMSGSNALVIQNLQSQLQTLQTSASGLSAKLNASLSSAIGSLSAASQKAANDVQAKIAQQNYQALTSIGSLGDRLALAMDTLSSGSAADQASLASADSEAWALAQAVQALGADAKTNVRAVLQKILAGQTSVAEVLRAKNTVNVAQMNTVSDVISGFVTLIQGYVTNVTNSFNDQLGKLSDFDKAIPVVVSAYRTSVNGAVTQAKYMVQQINATAINYNTLVNQTEKDAAMALQDAQARLEYATGNYSVSIDNLKAEIKAAAEAVEDSQDSLAKGLIAASQTSRSNVINKLRSFRAQKARETFNLATEDVQAPSEAPRISFN